MAGAKAVENLVVIGVFLALGAIAKRVFTLPERLPITINQFIINIALPAVILLKLPRLTLDRTVLLPMLAPWLVAALLAGLVRLLARRFRLGPDVTGALLLLTVYGNSSYFGFPMVRAFFGDAGLPPAIIFDQLGNFLMLAIFAPLIVARYSAADKPASKLAMLFRIVRFPPFLALLLGLTLNGVVYPPLLTQVLNLLALLLAPLAMFIVGLQLQWHVPGPLRKPLLLALSLRLVVAPLLTLGVCLASGSVDLVARVTVFEAAMPTMVTAAIMGVAANLAPRLCTAAVGFGLCIALVLLPLWYGLGHWLLH